MLFGVIPKFSALKGQGEMHDLQTPWTGFLGSSTLSHPSPSPVSLSGARCGPCAGNLPRVSLRLDPFSCESTSVSSAELTSACIALQGDEQKQLLLADVCLLHLKIMLWKYFIFFPPFLLIFRLMH